MPNNNEETSRQTGTEILFETSPGVLLDASVLHLSRHQITFETHTPGLILLASQALHDFRIDIAGREAYKGRATLRSVVHAGAGLICEAKLEDNWRDFASNGGSKLHLTGSGFRQYISKLHNTPIRTEFKLVIADTEELLRNLQQWTEQLELFRKTDPCGFPASEENAILGSICKEAFPLIAVMFDRLRLVYDELSPAEIPPHAAYAKRQLHPLVLCSPFMHRTFRKPLGYAGDYEMVNMMLRNPYEGPTTFAKIFNAYLLNEPPAVAHRNRIDQLAKMLSRELLRHTQTSRRARVLNIACGPAIEVIQFVRTSPLANFADFSLLDFNQETLDRTRANLGHAIEQSTRTTRVNVIRKSVAQLIKEATRQRPATPNEQYDVAYCAGLFDYMPDIICREILALGYRMLAPGGLLLATNVDACNPSRAWMEMLMDWHLIYRSAQQFQRLAPADAPQEACQVYSENTSVNVFLEVRKPGHG